MKKIILLFTACIIVLLIGCDNINQHGTPDKINDTGINDTGARNKSGNSPFFCSSNSDCVVKDVHNCCGYYPRCVNRDYIPDIEAVVRKCKEKGIVSVCGWAQISKCKCRQNKCVGLEGSVVV